MAVTVTTGGAISGYCAIGSERLADSPAMTMKIASTAAKIGRSMKNRENMRGLLDGSKQAYLGWSRGAGAAADAAPAGAFAIWIGAPGKKIRAMPSTITGSPSAR